MSKENSNLKPMVFDASPSLNRRSMLKRSLFSSMALGALGVVSSGKALGQSCGLTPAQVEGPFYPIWDAGDQDHDLTQVRGATQTAKGERILIQGVVQDEHCRPVAGAVVEIWQACVTGKYNHSADPNPAELDPHFQYWGRYITGEDGKYWFKTILPGAYPATSTWMRPPHIHFKVLRRGYHELTTQMYFDGQALNAQDRILMGLPTAERSKLIVNFSQQTWRGERIKQGQFNLSLQSI